MSSFLWVEDFENGQYREFAYTLFGKALALEQSDFPDEKIELCQFLESHHVHLVTTFVEGLLLIQNRLSEFDYFVIDIDLTLYPDQDLEKALPAVTPFMTKWHKYLPEHEESFNSAIFSMKRVAGYHLWIELVTQLGVDRDRILFASQHGRHLTTIIACFSTAYIKEPLTHTKNESGGSEWISRNRRNEYTTFRRGIIFACSELRGAKSAFRLQKRPNSLWKFSQDDGERLLDVLPLILPNVNLNNTATEAAFRLFIRTLTQNWDDTVDFDVLANDLSPLKRNQAFAFIQVILYSRNWTSHDATGLSKLDIRSSVFIFIIAFRAFFNLSQHSIYEYERYLLPLIGDYKPLNMGELLIAYKETFDDIDSKWNVLGIGPEKFLSRIVNDLYRHREIDHRAGANFLRMVFWHQLHFKDRNGNFNPSPQYFDNTVFLDEFTARLYRPGFN